MSPTDIQKHHEQFVEEESMIEASAWPTLYLSATQPWKEKRLKQLLQSKGSDRTPPVRGDTILCAAARFGNVAGVQAILDAGYDVNEKTPMLVANMQQESALETAALWGQVGVVKLLLSRGATANKAEALQAALYPAHVGCGGGSKEEYKEIAELLQA